MIVDKRTGNSNALRPTPIMIVAGVAFLALFVAWIPLHNWMAQAFNTSG